jgi:hypothetical protein
MSSHRTRWLVRQRVWLPWLLCSLLAVGVCSSLLAACGGTGGAHLSKGRAQAFAIAVNLRNHDVPGMGTFVAGFQAKNGPPFSGCTTHIAAADLVRAVDSPWFLRSKQQRRFGARVLAGRPPVEAVHSVVYVMNQPALAANNIAAARTPGTAACVQRTAIKQSSGRLIGHEQYKREIRASSLPFPLTGVPAFSRSGVPAYGLRVTGTVAGAVYHQKGRQEFYEDTFGFAVGPVEIVLHADGVGHPFPAEEERHLLFVLYGRAVTQHV